MTRAAASFDVIGWDQTPAESDDGGPSLSRAIVRKKFDGDLVGDSRAELLMCQADTADLEAGAGYVASEVVTGSLGGRSGSFVMHHWGVSGGGEAQQTGGHVVPGSGTGELAGLSGSLEMSVDADGAHTLTLDYELPEA